MNLKVPGTWLLGRILLRFRFDRYKAQRTRCYYLSKLDASSVQVHLSPINLTLQYPTPERIGRVSRAKVQINSNVKVRAETPVSREPSPKRPGLGPAGSARRPSAALQRDGTSLGVDDGGQRRRGGAQAEDLK